MASVALRSSGQTWRRFATACLARRIGLAVTNRRHCSAVRTGALDSGTLAAERLLEMNRLLLAPVALFVLATSASGAEATKHFGPGMSWLHIDYPAHFKTNPKSHEGEAKWWAKFDDPDSKLTVEVDSYGYINDLDLLLTIPGVNDDNFTTKLDELAKEGDLSTEELIAKSAKHKNIGDYFEAKIAPKGSSKKKFSGYTRFLHREKTSLTAYYLSDSAYKETFGPCFQVLTFKFPAGKYATHRKVIDQILASATPGGTEDDEQVAKKPAADVAQPKGSEKKPVPEDKSK